MNTLIKTAVLALTLACPLTACTQAVDEHPPETVAAAEAAPAVDAPTVETWEGTGTVFDTTGGALGEYTVELVRTPLDEGIFAVDVSVHLPDGTTRELQQTVTSGDGNGFRIESDGAQGGGMDLGEGMVSTYTEGPEGTAHASTIALDDDRMRIVRYELEDGEAVRISREVYRLVDQG